MFEVVTLYDAYRAVVPKESRKHSEEETGYQRVFILLLYQKAFLVLILHPVPNICPFSVNYIRNIQL